MICEEALAASKLFGDYKAASVFVNCVLVLCTLSPEKLALAVLSLSSEANYVRLTTFNRCKMYGYGFM